METKAVYNQRNFVTSWIFANVFGWILANILGFVSLFAPLGIIHWTYPLDIRNPQNSAVYDPLLHILLIPAAAIAVATIGLSQWQATLKHVAINGYHWVGVNAVAGAVIGLILSGLLAIESLPTINSIGIVASGLFGFVVGFSQSFVLRHTIQMAYMWVLANTLSSMTAFILFLVSGDFLKQNTNSLTFGYWIGIPLVFGAITGIVLYKLLQHRKQAPSE